VGSAARNVRLYPLYQVFFHAYFWLPVFFLYFSERLSLAQVLRLEAIYYITVVLLEVPSGYFSDVMGRRRTMIIATGALVVSYALFFFGQGFAMLAAAQVCLATGLAFNSGTDTALHFDSLSEVGRAADYGQREASVQRLALLGGAAAALLGGIAAAWQLRIAYGLSMLSALGAFVIVLLLVEPPRREAPGEMSAAQRGFFRQLAASVGHLRDRTLGWLMCFAVLMTVINHVPYEFYQPYLELLLDQRGVELPGNGAPLVTGVITAITTMIAAWAAGRSIRLRNRIGLAPTLLLMTTIQVVIMTAMGVVVHEVVLILVLFRSVPSATMQPPMRAAITPRLPQSLRATYLSMQSLAGRLAFAGTLWLLSTGIEPGIEPGWPALSWMSRTCALGGFAGFLVLAVSARHCLKTTRSGSGPDHDLQSSDP